MITNNLHSSVDFYYSTSVEWLISIPFLISSELSAHWTGDEKVPRMPNFYFQNLDSPGMWDLRANTDKVLTQDKLSTLLKTLSFFYTQNLHLFGWKKLLLTQSY